MKFINKGQQLVLGGGCMNPVQEVIASGTFSKPAQETRQEIVIINTLMTSLQVPGGSSAALSAPRG